MQSDVKRNLKLTAKNVQYYLAKTNFSVVDCIAATAALIVLQAERKEALKSKSSMTQESNNQPQNDPINHPQHYTSHPSGIECIEITRHMGFNLGNAMKYLWRAGLKSGDPIQDLGKAMWYIQDEVNKLRGIYVNQNKT